MAEEKQQDNQTQQQSEPKAVDNTKRAEVQKAVDEHKNNPGQREDYIERIDEKTSKH